MYSFLVVPVCVCAHVCVRACVCVVGVIVERPVLPPSVVDGRFRNPLYYYYYYYYFKTMWLLRESIVDCSNQFILRWFRLLVFFSSTADLNNVCFFA